MNDIDKITELINQNYHLENITSLRKITMDNVNNFIAVNNPQINREYLLDPKNKDKYLIQFRDLKKNKRIELITGDKKVITRAMEYKSYLNQPIGISIQAICVAMGSGSSEMMISHVDNLISSIGGVSGWKFKKIDRLGAFNADIRINSIDKFEKDKALDILQNFLNSLAVAKNVGFRI